MRIASLFQRAYVGQNPYHALPGHTSGHGAVITLGIMSQKEMIRDQVNHQGEILAETIEGGMDDALSVGNNDLVRQQFCQVKGRCPISTLRSAISTRPFPFRPIRTLSKNHRRHGENQATPGRSQGQWPIHNPWVEPFGEEIDGMPISASFDRSSMKIAATTVMVALGKCWVAYWSAPPPQRLSMPSEPCVTGGY